MNRPIKLVLSILIIKVILTKEAISEYKLSQTGLDNKQIITNDTELDILIKIAFGLNDPKTNDENSSNNIKNVEKEDISKSSTTTLLNSTFIDESNNNHTNKREAIVNSSTTDTDQTISGDGDIKEECICVPYYACDPKNRKIYGEGLIDER